MHNSIINVVDTLSLDNKVPHKTDEEHKTDGRDEESLEKRIRVLFVRRVALVLLLLFVLCATLTFRVNGEAL